VKPLSFQKFKEIYKQIEERGKHKIFYYSLFDISSFIFIEKMSKLGKELSEIDRKINEEIPNLFLKRGIKRTDKLAFVRRNVYSDRLCRFLIAIELKNKGIECRISEEGDIEVNKSIVEIKRIVAGTQLSKYVEEIMKKYEGSNKNLVLLLIFPRIGEEDVERMSKLIEIYYVVEKFLSLKIEKVKVICQYIAREEIENYNLSNLIERIVKVIKELEEI
jgi:hypothetical protein